MILHPCKLTDLSGVTSEYATGVLSQGHLVLVVHLTGTIENRRTTDDYAFAAASIIAGLEAWQPWALVIDLSRASYSWGDGMENVLSVSQRWAEPIMRSRSIFIGDSLPSQFPTAVVTSGLNEGGLTTLVSEQMNMSPSKLLFPSVEAAVAALDKCLLDTPLI